MVLARPFARIDGSPEGGPTRSTESAQSVDRVAAVGLTELTKSVDRSRRVGLTEFVRSVHRVARVGLTEVAKGVGGRRRGGYGRALRRFIRIAARFFALVCSP